MTTPMFRSTLAHRILSLLAVSLPATLLLDGCYHCTDESSGFRTVCIDPAKVNGGGAGGGGAASTGGGGAASTGGSGAGGSTFVCPSREDAGPAVENENGRGAVELLNDGVYNGSECCYDVLLPSDCGAGRPFLVGREVRAAGEVRRAPRIAGEVRGALHTADDGRSEPRRAGDGRGAGGWREAGARRPEIASLDPETRARLAAEWARDGLFEHASVASFARFALDLLAAGAPSDLVEDAHRAAVDEVRHARLCLSLASAYAGQDISPGPFPAGASVDVTANLAALAARCAEEGAIGETVAAVTAAEQLARATDPAVCAALAVIAEDEARHAELAWRTVAWAVRAGGAPVRAAVSAVFARLAAPAPPVVATPHDERLLAHGRLGEAEKRDAAARAIEEIVLPAARLLLAAEARSTQSETPMSTRPFATDPAGPAALG